MFQNRLSHIDTYHIADIEKSIDDEKALYDIYYKDENGREYRLALYYLKGPYGGVIRFKHQEKIAWLKREVQKEE